MDPAIWSGFDPKRSQTFLAAGQIIEDNEPEEFFNDPQNVRTQLFLSQIM